MRAPCQLRRDRQGFAFAELFESQAIKSPLCSGHDWPRPVIFAGLFTAD
jgi:hypothetical protein